MNHPLGSLNTLYAATLPFLNDLFFICFETKYKFYWIKEGITTIIFWHFLTFWRRDNTCTGCIVYNTYATIFYGSNFNTAFSLHIYDIFLWFYDRMENNMVLVMTTHPLFCAGKNTNVNYYTCMEQYPSCHLWCVVVKFKCQNND